MPTPTIYDILGWQEDWDTRQEEYQPTFFGYPIGGTATRDVGGQLEAGDYLSGLLHKSGTFKDLLEPGGETFKMSGLVPNYSGEKERGAGAEMSMEDLSMLTGDEGFIGMSREDLESGIQNIYTGFAPTGEGGESFEEIYSRIKTAMPSLPGSGGYAEFQSKPGSDYFLFEKAKAEYEAQEGITWSAGEVDTFWGEELGELTDYLQALQEGMGRMGSISERFDLKGQLAGGERELERESGKALQSYIPREIASRYGALQGAGGERDRGEAAEAKYLSQLSAGQRRQGRDVRSIRRELSDKMFGGLGDWMQNITS